MAYTTTMGNLFKKILALTVTASLFAAPLAYAQSIPADASTTPTVADSASTTITTPAPAISTTPVGQTDTTIILPIDLQGASTSVQNTANTQDTLTGNTLENTTNPESATTTDATSTPVVNDPTATTTDPINLGQNTSDASSTPVVADDASTTLDVVAEDVTKDLPVPDEQPAPVPLVLVAKRELTPDTIFTFALTGRQIAAKQIVTSKDGTKTGEQTVTAKLAPQIDNASGVLSVSGQCSDVYFVVLLYRGANDYADDPSSYIVNRAYPCVGGSYSYSIADLPNNLANGEYYLLVGQEGERGTWTPITSLTEITINKN